MNIVKVGKVAWKVGEVVVPLALDLMSNKSSKKRKCKGFGKSRRR